MNGNPPHSPQQPGPQRGPQRPGAMTMAMQAVQSRPTGPKVLRIGLIQSGKIIEERIIRKRETVSVGTSERNHFVIQAPGMPSRFDLFQLVGNDYILNFTPQMRGKVGLPSGVQDLAMLAQTGAARNAGNYYQVKLTDNSRGKVVVGDTTLLFQFVVPPPVQPRPQLPAAARGGFVKGIDWVFTAFVVFSFMVHFGFVIYLENADWPINQNIDLQDTVARFIVQEPPEPEVIEQGEQPTEEGEQEEEQATKTKERTPNENTQSDIASNAEARARIAAEAASTAEQMLIGALGEGGALNDVLAGGAVTGNAEDVLAMAAGVGVAQGAGGAIRTRSGGGTGSGLGGGLGGLASRGEGQTGARQEGTQVIERVIRGRATLEDGDAVGGAGDFDASLVVRMIRTRLRAIQMCYERELRRNPTLAGKVTVQFTIEVQGSVSGARAIENTTGDAAVASCVVSTIGRFRFNPGPEGGSVQFAYPFVFAPQN